jgi:hypothetical protein
MLVKTGVIFENGSGAAKAVSTGYTDTGGTEYFEAGAANVLVVGYTVSGTAPTTLVAKVIMSPDGGTTEYPCSAINSISGGNADTDDAVFGLPVTVASHSFEQPITPGLQYKVQFIRTGGAADTKVLANGYFVQA